MAGPNAALSGDGRQHWADMMQASIATVEERFSSERMVGEYFTRLHARD